MKKLNNKTAMALLRGAVALVGLTCTFVGMLLTDSWQSFIMVWLAGGAVVTLVDDYMKSLTRK